MKELFKKHIVPIFIILVLAIEGYIASLYYIGADPYPYEDFYFRMISCSLRDIVIGAVAGVLYYRKKRIPDRTRRYFPVVVIGFMHIAACFFMINQLTLDWSVQTVLAILAGINNNILMVLLAAICYHKWPTKTMKAVYFVAYFFSAYTIIFDMFYFWQTGMHIESVLFQNLNIYAVKGVLATTSNELIAAVCIAFVIIILLFRTEPPAKRKPNFAWSLLCVAAFTIGMNLADRVLGALGMYAVENVIGAYIEIENEKTRVLYRESLSIPINLNFIGKALFDTDKMASRGHVEQRELTEKDKKSLAELGIKLPKPAVKKISAQYDKVVMLILESVHRDYINYFNKNIPEKATPFLNSLIIKQPHLDRYYSSAIPTTQGLNATFRSHLIMDKDVPGRINPSIFKSVQAAGYRGIFMNASSHYYANELREYPDQFGMKEYYAREHLEKLGYTGASGWGFHNDVMYEHTLKLLEEGKNDKMFLVTKTLDMHQPYPFEGVPWAEMPEGVRDNPNFTVRGMYWVDKTLKHFFEEVEKRGLDDGRTLFIITADHNPHSGGEYTKIVDKAEDKLPIAPLPLIFMGKNLQPLNNLRTHEFASQIDLAPTILYLLGIDVPEKFMGRNLLQEAETPFAVGYFGGKAYYWSEKMHFVDQMDKPVPDSDYEDALSNYLIHHYGVWHKE